MQSSLVNKLEKAKVYARERHRMHVDTLQMTFKGENSDHTVTLDADAWHCNCDFFAGWNVCSHTMAVEKVFEGMTVPKQAFPVRATA